MTNNYYRISLPDRRRQFVFFDDSSLEEVAAAHRSAAMICGSDGLLAVWRRPPKGGVASVPSICPERMDVFALAPIIRAVRNPKGGVLA